MGILRKTVATSAPCSTFVIRLVVGGTFLIEGIQKFLFPDALGVGRFVKIGIPCPEVMAPFVGVFEVVCGGLLILGLLTRLAAMPMIVNISVAIVSTKIPILLGHGFWMFSLRNVNLRLLEHDARSPHRLRHAPGRASSSWSSAQGCLSFDALLAGCCHRCCRPAAALDPAERPTTMTGFRRKISPAAAMRRGTVKGCTVRKKNVGRPSNTRPVNRTFGP